MPKDETRRSIPFGAPQLDASEIDAVSRVLAGPQLVHGPVAQEFEAAFADRLSVKHAITVSSCTAGLHLGLHVEHIGPGDEVIVPAMTHVATAHSVEYCGAKPVFADVLDTNGNIDPAAVSDASGAATRAITAVHYIGLPCEMDALGVIAAKHNAFVMEDCALAVDAEYDGVKTGGLGRLGCFSFYPVKHLTTGEGGMVTTNDDALAERIRRQKAFGYDRGLGQRKRPGIYDVVSLGYNYRMSELHAAVGMAQLAKLDNFQRARTQNFEALKSALDEIDEITVFEPIQGKARSSHYCLNAVLPRDGRIDRAAVVDRLSAAGVGSSVHYPAAVPLFGYYREKYGYRAGQFPVAEWLAAQTISLPVGPHLKPDDPGYIARTIKTAIHDLNN